MTSHPTVDYVRPGFILSHLANPIFVRLGFFPTLTVVGRRTGQPHSNPIGAPFALEGHRYLVSGRGETQWARNLRAAGRCQLRQQGRTEDLQAVEISGDERIRVVRAYRESLGHSVDGYFRRLPEAADHPVFRLEPGS